MSDDRTDSDQSRSKRLKISDSAVSNGNSSSPAVLRAGRTAVGSETGSATTAAAAAFHSAATNSPQSHFPAAAANGDSGREVKLNPKMSKLLSTSAKR